MNNPKKVDVTKIQLENVRFNGRHYTGANGLYCGADADLNSVAALQGFFNVALAAHQSRLSSFMPVNPEHGLHCTIVYSKTKSSLQAHAVRDYANQLQADNVDGFDATVKGFDFWPDKGVMSNGASGPKAGHLVVELDFPEAAQLSAKVQKDLGVQHTFADDFKAHMTLCSGRDAAAYAPYVPFLNERARALGPLSVRFNFIGIRDIQ